MAPQTGSPIGASAFATTLEEAVQQAVLRNPDVGAAAGDRRAADEQISQARSGLFPQVDLRGTIGPEYANTPSTRGASSPAQSDHTFYLGRTDQSFSLRQMLFDGFQVLSDVDRRRQLSDSAAAQVMQTSEQTGLDAIETYLDVRRFTDIVQINRGNVRTQESYVAALQRRMDLGGGDASDLRRAESRLAAARNGLSQSEGQLKDARSRYQRIVGDAPANLKPPAPPVAAVPPDDEAAVLLAVRGNPRVRRALSDVEAARANLRNVRGSFYPQLDVEFNAQTGVNLRGIPGRDSSAAALLVLRYPLSRGGQDLARVNEAVERLSAANERLTGARQDAERDMRLAVSALKTARERLVAANDQVASDARGRDAFRRLFDVGRTRILDLLDSERDYYASLSQRATQEATAVFGVYRVLQSGGVLLRTLKVRPRDEAFGDDETPWAAEVAAQTGTEPPVFDRTPGVAPPLTPSDPAIVPLDRGSASPSATMWLRGRRSGGYLGPAATIPPIGDTPEAIATTWPQKIDDLPPLSDVRPPAASSPYGMTSTPPEAKTPWPDTVRPPPLGEGARPGTAAPAWPAYVPVLPLNGNGGEAPPLDPAKAAAPPADPKGWRYGMPLPPIGDEPSSKSAAKPQRSPAVEAAEARQAAKAAEIAPAAGPGTFQQPPPVYARGAWRHGLDLPPLGDSIPATPARKRGGTPAKTPAPAIAPEEQDE